MKSYRNEINYSKVMLVSAKFKYNIVIKKYIIINLHKSCLPT